MPNDVTNPESALPVRAVSLLEDRAQVERRGELTLAGGRRTFEITGISMLAVDRSLEVTAEGASVVDAGLHRRLRERPAGGVFADASALRRRVDELEQELRAHDDAQVRIEVQRQALATARADVLRAIAEGVGAGVADAAQWHAQLEHASQRGLALDGRLRDNRREHDACARRLTDARAALAVAEQPEPERECLLRITLEGEGAARVRVRYQVPCAAWRPAYRARLHGGVVTIEQDAVLWQNTGEAWRDVEISLSTARPTLGTTPPSLTEDRLHTRPKTDTEKQTVDVAVREVDIADTGEGRHEDALPGVDDGGEVRRLVLASRTDLPSDGEPHRVSLSSFTAPATVETLCVPELGTEAQVVARFANLGAEPLMAGPVDVLRSSGYVGRTQLGYVAPGEAVRLSFGSEDGVVVTRRVAVTKDASRLTGRTTQRTTVTLAISNASPLARTLVVEERVPVSEVKEVEIEVDARACSPAPRELTRDGIAKLELELPPHGTRTASFVWELSAAGKVAGL
ncbi:MAG: mucoidy inhibitor MuiA family protein [Deltaproteobacteria bacterium]|nr:mucoidy inhibitor MuiA family protein [Deltaproteobacteria bacterium]